MKELDEKDFLLLDLLGEGSRKGTNKFSKRLRLHKNAVLYRIERLKKKGIIKCFSFIPGIASLNKNTFYVFFRINAEEKERASVYEYLRNYPLALWSVRLLGRWNVMVELICTDINHFNDELSKITDHLGNKISDYKTLLLYQPYKVESCIRFRSEYAQPSFQVSRNIEVLDSLDKKILGVLSSGSDLSYGEIAKKVGSSSDTVFYRIKKLSASRIIRKFVPIIDMKMLGFQQYAVVIRLSDVSKANFERIRNYLNSNKNVFLAFRTAGELGVAFFCTYKDNSEFDIFITNMNNYFGGIIKEEEVFPISEVLALNYFPEGLRE